MSPCHHRTTRRLAALVGAALLLAACGGSEVDPAALVASDQAAGTDDEGDAPASSTSTTATVGQVAEDRFAPGTPEATVVGALLDAAEQGYRFEMAVGTTDDPSLVDPSVPEGVLDELDRAVRGLTAAGMSDGTGGESVVFGSEYDRSFSLTVRVVDDVAYTTSSMIGDRWLSLPAPEGSGGLAPSGFPVDDMLQEVATGVVEVMGQVREGASDQEYVVDLYPPPLDPVITGQEPLQPGEPIPEPGVRRAEITLDDRGVLVAIRATYQVGTTMRVELFDHGHGTTVEVPEGAEPMDALSLQELVQGGYVA